MDLIANSEYKEIKNNMLFRKMYKILLHFISGDNSQLYMILMVVCLFEIGLWINYQEPTRPYLSSNARPLVGQRILGRNEDKQIIDSNLTGQIWNFEDEDDEKIYLYEKLLKKEHAFNETNIKMFRNELQFSLGDYLYNHMIIDQQNTPINYTFKFGTRKKSPTVEISEEVHKLLPRRTVYETVPRCSVVGNSGSILGSKCGTDVDKANFVFRCNAAPIAKYAVDAGYKSNLTTFNPSILTTRYNKFSRPEGVLRFVRDMRQYHGIVWAPCFTSSSMELCLDIMKTYTLNENKFVLGHPDHFLKIQKFWESRGHKGKISSGFFFTTIALSRCREVHLYGFWPFSKMTDRALQEVPYHYFDQLNFTSFNNLRQHNMNSEFSVLLQLHMLGVLRIHVGECHQ